MKLARALARRRVNYDVHCHLLYVLYHCTVPPAVPLSNATQQQQVEWNFPLSSAVQGKARAREAREVHKNRFHWPYVLTPLSMLIRYGPYSCQWHPYSSNAV